MAEDLIAYDKSDLRAIYKAFKAMDEEATASAKKESNALATYLQGKIGATAAGANNKVAPMIAAGSRVSKSAKTGEISYGFASQKLSGGGTTQMLGAVMNSDLINLSNSQSGLEKKAADHVDGLFIRLCVPNSLTSSTSGKMRSVVY